MFYNLVYNVNYIILYGNIPIIQTKMLKGVCINLMQKQMCGLNVAHW